MFSKYYILYGAAVAGSFKVNIHPLRSASKCANKVVQLMKCVQWKCVMLSYISFSPYLFPTFLQHKSFVLRQSSTRGIFSTHLWPHLPDLPPPLTCTVHVPPTFPSVPPLPPSAPPNKEGFTSLTLKLSRDCRTELTFFFL